MTWYLDVIAVDAREVWYDVRTDGVPGDEPHDVPSNLTDNPAMLRMWKAQTAKRCDAIVRADAGFWVVELRYTAVPQTIGEMAQYDLLTRAEWPELHWLPAALVCVNVDPMVRHTLQAHGNVIHLAPHGAIPLQL